MSPDSKSGLPSIALDPQGNPRIIFFEVENGAYEGVRLKAAAKDENLWETSEVSTASDMGYVPGIATDSEGNTLISYDACVEGKNVYSVFLASDSIGDYISKEIIPGDGFCYEMPTVKIGSDGKIHLAYLRWIADEAEEIFIYEVRYGYLDGEGFVSEVIDDSFLLSEESYGSPEGSSPIDFVLVNDVPNVLYVDGGSNLCLAKRISAGNWHVDTVQAQSLMLSAAVDEQGKLHLAYRKGESYDSIYYSTNKTGTWQHEFVAKVQEPAIGSNFGGNSAFSLDLDPKGNPQIVWSDYRLSDFFSDVYRSWKTPGGWSKEPVLSDPDLAEGNQFCRFFKIDGEGYGHVAYMAGSGDDDIHVYYARSKEPIGETSSAIESPPRPPHVPLSLSVEGARIRFELSQSSFVRLTLYDATGRMVKELASGTYPAGQNEMTVNSKNLPAGVYFARLESGKTSASVRVVIIR
jgi:hypothetical protein